METIALNILFRQHKRFRTLSDWKLLPITMLWSHVTNTIFRATLSWAIKPGTQQWMFRGSTGNTGFQWSFTRPKNSGTTFSTCKMITKECLWQHHFFWERGEIERIAILTLPRTGPGKRKSLVNPQREHNECGKLIQQNQWSNESTNRQRDSVIEVVLPWHVCTRIFSDFCCCFCNGIYFSKGWVRRCCTVEVIVASSSFYQLTPSALWMSSIYQTKIIVV